MRLKGYQGMVDGGECIELAEWKTVSGIIQKVSLLLLCILSTGTEIFIVNAYLILKRQVLIVIYSLCWCSTACTVKCLRTAWNCANQSQVPHQGNISDPPPNSSWSYRATDSAFMADGLSVWLVHWSGIP